MTAIRTRLALAGAVSLAACVPPPPAPVVRPTPVATPAGPTSAAWLATAADVTTLAGAAKASGLAETLAGPGPFTLFAPTDAAFGRLAPGMVDALLQPENRAVLGKLLTYHVVAGSLSVADLTARVAAGNGSATLTTVEGEPLTLTITEGHLTLTDGDGNHSYVETGDLRQANGIVHVVNGVLVPRMG